MRRLTISFIILFFSGLFLSEIPTIISKIWPRTIYLEYNLFLDKRVTEKISVLWYIYELAALINRVIWAYAFCRVAIIISDRLFKAGVAFMFYQVGQCIFYCWNRNSSFVINLCLYVVMAIYLFFILAEKSKIKSMYKSIE